MRINTITKQQLNRGIRTNTPNKIARSNCFEWTNTIGSVATRVDLQEPNAGMSLTSNDTLFSTLHILFPESSVLFKDGWIREHDATGIYAINDARQLQTSILWRLQSSWCPMKNLEKSLTAELILSNQTLREQSDGALAMECTVLATSVRTAVWSRDCLLYTSRAHET